VSLYRSPTDPIERSDHVSLSYQFQLSIALGEPSAQALLVDLQQVAGENNSPSSLPDGLDIEASHLADWLQQDIRAGQLRLVNQDTSKQLTWWGELSDERFYADFLPLLEWLAEASGARGYVGTFHTPSLPHPTAVYFADGQPYSLQLKGNPTGMAAGDAIDERDLLTEVDEPDPDTERLGDGDE